MGLSSYGTYQEKYADLYNQLTEYNSIFGRLKENEEKFPNYENDLKETMDCAKTTQVLFKIIFLSM